MLLPSHRRRNEFGAAVRLAAAEIGVEMGKIEKVLEQVLRGTSDANISFETESPKAFVCGENSTAELSGLHYKDGSRSLRWSWSAPPSRRALSGVISA